MCEALLFHFSVARKHPSRCIEATLATSLLTSSRIFIVFNTISKYHFIVDTGANCNIWPINLLHECRQPTSFTLQEVNHSLILTYGETSLIIDFN